MTLIAPTQLTDGSTHTAADHNGPINTIVNDYNGNITNANISASAAIDFSKLAGGSANGLLTWTSWTPTWTNLTVGNATVAAYYAQIGKIIIAELRIVLGSTSSVGSNPLFTLPATASSHYVATSSDVHPIGPANYLRAGVANYTGVVTLSDTSGLTKGALTNFSVNGTSIANSGLSATSPATWASGDKFTVSFTYEAA